MHPRQPGRVLQRPKTQQPFEFQGRERVITGTVPRLPPDVRQQIDLREQHATHRHPPQLKNGEKVTSAGMTMMDWHGTTVANSTVSSAAANPYQTTLAIPQNFSRKSFWIINPDSNANTLYFSYKNSPNSLIPLIPGGTYKESGTDCSTDDIYVWASVAMAYGAYEGVSDNGGEYL